LTLISFFSTVTTLQFISSSSPREVEGISLLKHQLRVLVHRVGLLHKLFCSTAAVERIDETVGTITINIDKEMEMISSMESPYKFYSI
jgi:hypothetical protein